MIVDAANQYGVPPSIALGVAAHESGFNPNATNLNTNGTTDYGVMQLNSTTVSTLGVTNPLDPQQNINAGVSLLGQYLQKYNGNVQDALWAYASGPGAVSSGTMNATASQFVGYVTSYTPDPTLGVDVSGSLNSSLSTASDTGTDSLSLAFGDFGTAVSTGDFSGVSMSDWLVLSAGLGLLLFAGYLISGK